MADTDTEDNAFEELLEQIKASRNIDFRGYKRVSLHRRFLKRMQQIGMEDFKDYARYLEEHSEEYALLFNTILINVTSFFRDPAAWEYLQKEVLTRLLADKSPQEPIRIWSAGCASGEEAFTLAMLMAELLGMDAFLQRVKIYGTDIDEDALNVARRAAFSDKSVQDIPNNLLNKYFYKNSEKFIFNPDLRRSVIFGNHDLVRDAPISRLDLLVCRNTLMYFNSDVQKKVLTLFHFALADNGFLFLGKAETLLSYSDIFSSMEIKHRIFVKKSNFNLRDRAIFLAETGIKDLEPVSLSQARLREIAIESSPNAHVLVDSSGLMTNINQRARSLFNLNLKDLGRQFKELDISYRPAELRSVIERVLSANQLEKISKVPFNPMVGEIMYLDITVLPLKGLGRSPLGVDIIFEDVTVNRQLEEDLQRSNQELETLNEELQSAHEELETTNEELQSTNEELETTNEELQSANEELETINEELQSTNEELITLNEDHQRRTEELNTSNSFLQSILSSLHAGVAVMDRSLTLLLWNKRAEDLWGLRADEVHGKSLMGLDIGLPVEQLPLKSFMSGATEYQEFTLDAVNRRGKSFRCRVECIGFTNGKDSQQGTILIMDEVNSWPKENSQ